MADGNKDPEQKKGIPGGFLLFVCAIVLVILTVQTLTSDKHGRVSFSHQLEHLTNLNLLHPEENKKVALKDNLVTFSGKFRESESEEGNNRFYYLDLLNKQHTLSGEKERLSSDLSKLNKDVAYAASYFLSISGTPVPKGGYVVVGRNYNTPERNNAVTIESVNPESYNLAALENSLGNITAESAPGFQRELLSLVQMYLSPNLALGSEVMKQKLKTAEKSLKSMSGTLGTRERIALYSTVLGDLRSVTNQLNGLEDDARLTQLRSVRSYLSNLDQYGAITSDLEANSSLLSKARSKVANVIWFFNNKEISTRALEKQDSEAFNHWFEQAKTEWNAFAANRGLAFKAPDQPLNSVLQKKFKSQEPAPNYFNYIFTFLPVILIFLLLYFMFSKQVKGVGSQAMNFGKSPAKLLTKDSNKVTFKDVAGAEESKEELTEIVDFLKDPSKFTALGAKIPKGVLLVGPPGTGKTLIARAVAGEAERPFFSISGSDFVEMFVGVGASRIRDMFETAKKNAPCIIFMDEIDAVGRHRGAGIGGGHDEREQTLNQLLVEMDGFDTREGVILIAATNRPDILDKALLRPGRFDRRVTLDLPDVKGRLEILKVHARKIKIDPSVELMDIARNTPGASGADLENILNEAALLAARRGRTAVTAAETKEACDKVRYGKERKSLEMDEEEKKSTAYHESGHAIVGLVVERSDPVDKVTIIPRGMSLGATHFMPKKNRLGYWRKEAIDLLAVLMGGRAAEEIFVKDMSSGAQQDIAQATNLARSMVCEWGMSENMGLVSYEERSESGQYLGMSGYKEKSYSDETAKQIDAEIKTLLDEAHSNALKILDENKEKVQLMTDMLMEFETLDSQDVKEIMDNSWNADSKRERLKMAEESHRKVPPPPPTIQENPDIQPQPGT